MKAETMRTDALRPLSDIQIEQTREFIDSLEQGSQTYWDMVEIGDETMKLQYKLVKK